MRWTAANRFQDGLRIRYENKLNMDQPSDVPAAGNGFFDSPDDGYFPGSGKFTFAQAIAL